MLDNGAPGGALEHEFVVADKEWAGVVVRVALAGSEFGSPDSMPMQFTMSKPPTLVAQQRKIFVDDILPKCANFNTFR